MVSDVLYGRDSLKPYFDMGRFEDNIFKRQLIRERKTKTRKKFVVIDKVLNIATHIAGLFLIILFMAVIYRSIEIKNIDNNIERLKELLQTKVTHNRDTVASLKNDIPFDEIKIKAYMELSMITPTEKNIIRFNKSDTQVVHQYVDTK